MPGDDETEEVRYLPTGRGLMRMLFEQLSEVSRIAEALCASDIPATEALTPLEYSEMATHIQSISVPLMTLSAISKSWRRTSDRKANL